MTTEGGGREDRVFAGVELGGTKAIAVVWREGRIVDRLVVPTTGPHLTLSPIGDWLASHPLQPAFAALGIASFGPVRLDPAAADRGHILATPKPGWAGAPVLAALAGRVRCPVALDTDVNAAALAEHRWGAGRGCSNLVYLTIGTGIGGGMLVDGRPVHGLLHPEIGHLRLRRAPGDTFAGTCPFHGDCLEGLVAGPALAVRFRGDIHEAPLTDPRRDHLHGDLAQLLAALILTVSPQKILIGGGVGLGVPGLREGAIARLPAILGGYLPQLDADALDAMIAAPQFGADAGPLGAIALAQTIAAERKPHG